MPHMIITALRQHTVIFFSFGMLSYVTVFHYSLGKILSYCYHRNLKKKKKVRESESGRIYESLIAQVSSSELLISDAF